MTSIVNDLSFDEYYYNIEMTSLYNLYFVLISPTVMYGRLD